MNPPFLRPALPALVALSLLLSGCGSMSGADLWPFGDDKPMRPVAPTNSTEYQCTGGKRFYVRHLDSDAAWVIFPDREFRLDKVAAMRYSNGVTTLDLNGSEATLAGGTLAYAGCKTVAAGSN